MTIHVARERDMLEAMLDVQRTEIAALLDGLDEDEARARLVPSLTTPLALVAHATFVEKVWFHARVAGRSRAEVGIPDTPEESFVLGPSDTISSIRDAYLAACEGSRTIAAGASLDDEYPWHHGPVSLRFVYVHMIAELARHAGQGDILVEQLAARRTASGGS
jgi:hypothetical protein